MDESREEDVKGVHSTLQVLENLCVVKPSLCSLVCEKTGLMRVLVTRVKAKRFDEIKGYCAEMLAILLAVSFLLCFASMCVASHTDSDLHKTIGRYRESASIGSVVWY